MLNIGKLAPGGEEYYLDTVAAGVEDYYTGAGEAPGRWLDTAPNRRLGLSGRVDAETLSAVLAGRDPETGERLTRAAHRKIPGFDLTFRAPKSVALLYGLAEPEISGQVRKAHDAAVEAAVGYLQRRAARTRRGTDGIERIAATGLVAAAFRHRTSRAQDPLLHTHVLAANLARAADGDPVWRTLDARGLYAHAKTAGYLYQAHLRDQLTRRLGVTFHDVTNGYADIAGIPRDIIEAFSRRRAQILAALDARGQDSARAAQIATLDTRTAKPAAEDPVGLRERWRVRARDLGFDPTLLTRLLDRQQPDDRSDLAAAAERLLGEEGLTARASSFTHRDVLQGWCEQLPTGAPVTEVETLADQLLEDDGRIIALDDADSDVRRLDRSSVIVRTDGTAIPSAPDEAAWSTAGLLTLEQDLVDRAVARHHDEVAQVDAADVQAVLADRPTIGEDQAAMVRQLTTSGAGVEVVVGKAGAGKTYALDAARQAWVAAGHRVVGAALAARAARQLTDDAGIPATTIARLLTDLDRQPAHHQQESGPPAVLVIDEASMVGTRTLARLLDHAERAGSKVVLVGDPYQLPEIDAGGAFRGLANRLDTIRLTTNRRQPAAWERHALDELRTGTPKQAIAAYRDHQRITVGDDPADTRRRLVGDWWHATTEHGLDALLIARTRAEVADLNTRARRHATAAGALSGPALTTAAGVELQAGDRVVCLRNDRRLGVDNGTRGTVTAVHPADGAIDITVNDDGDIRLPAAYLDAGHVDHGYAITAHKAQGLTCDATHVLASDGLYREWVYVALSRGRHDNRLYLTHTPELHDGHRDCLAHGCRQDAPPAEQRLDHGVERSRRQQLAVDQTDPPGWLTRLLGPRPTDSRTALAAWHHTATAVRTYRDRWDIDDTDLALGPTPPDLEQAAHRDEVTAAIRNYRHSHREHAVPTQARRQEHSRDIA